MCGVQLHYHTTKPQQNHSVLVVLYDSYTVHTAVTVYINFGYLTYSCYNIGTINNTYNPQEARYD